MGNMKRQGGVSLIELSIYMFLLVVVLGIVFRMAILNRRQIEKPAASFRIQQDLLSVQEILRRDLTETNLSTVRIFPNPDFPDAPPGMSLISPRGIKDDEIQTTQFGNPYWQKIIYYTLEKDPDRQGVGRLVRKENVIAGLPSAQPKASPEEPSKADYDPETRKVVARYVLLPNQKVPQLGLDLKEQGGFEVFFMDPDGNRSITDSQNHPIVGIDLFLREISSSTGETTVMKYPVRVYPRH